MDVDDEGRVWAKPFDRNKRQATHATKQRLVSNASAIGPVGAVCDALRSTSPGISASLRSLGKSTGSKPTRASVHLTHLRWKTAVSAMRHLTRLELTTGMQILVSSHVANFAQLESLSLWLVKGGQFVVDDVAPATLRHLSLFFSDSTEPSACMQARSASWWRICRALESFATNSATPFLALKPCFARQGYALQSASNLASLRWYAASRFTHAGTRDDTVQDAEDPFVDTAAFVDGHRIEEARQLVLNAGDMSRIISAWCVSGSVSDLVLPAHLGPPVYAQSASQAEALASLRDAVFGALDAGLCRAVGLSFIKLDFSEESALAWNPDTAWDTYARVSQALSGLRCPLVGLVVGLPCTMALSMASLLAVPSGSIWVDSDTGRLSMGLLLVHHDMHRFPDVFPSVEKQGSVTVVHGYAASFLLEQPRATWDTETVKDLYGAIFENVLTCPLDTCHHIVWPSPADVCGDNAYSTTSEQGMYGDAGQRYKFYSAIYADGSLARGLAMHLEKAGFDLRICWRRSCLGRTVLE